MSSSLVSFLERRKKTAVKASTLLQKTEEQSEDENPDKDAEEEQEAQSEHDNEWRVSSDESDEIIQQSNFGPNLVKIVQTVENSEPEDSVKESQERKTQQIWPREVEQPVEEPVTKPKIWVPKFRDSKGILSSKNDVDLAESVKMFTKSVSSLKKKKKTKPKTQEQDDDFAVVKVKFDVFSLLKEEYSQFKSEKYSMDEQLIKMKYSNRQLV